MGGRGLLKGELQYVYAFKTSVPRCQSYFLLFKLFFCIFQYKIETVRKMVYCNSTWSQVRTELVQNATGPGQRASGTVLIVMKAVKSQGVSGADGEVPGPLRFVSTAAHCPTTCSQVLAFSIPYVCSFSLCGRASRFAWTSTSFFSGSSACASASSLCSHGADFQGGWC